MCNPTPPASPVPTPWGHSEAAHRVFGWCCHCKEHGTAEEVGAWRVREMDRHAAEQAARASQQDHRLDLKATNDRPCPDCGRPTLTVVTAYIQFATGPRAGDKPCPTGGWAFCTSCEATPHPTMEESRG